MIVYCPYPLHPHTDSTSFAVVSFARDHEKMRKVSILIVFYFIFDDWVDKNGMKLDKSTVMALLPPPSEVPIKPVRGLPLSTVILGITRTD